MAEEIYQGFIAVPINVNIRKLLEIGTGNSDIVKTRILC